MHFTSAILAVVASVAMVSAKCTGGHKWEDKTAAGNAVTEFCYEVTKDDGAYSGLKVWKKNNPEFRCYNGVEHSYTFEVK
jgi:hypothetical protein